MRSKLCQPHLGLERAIDVGGFSAALEELQHFSEASLLPGGKCFFVPHCDVGWPSNLSQNGPVSESKQPSNLCLVGEAAPNCIHVET